MAAHVAPKTEVLRLLTAAARSGSVPAQKTLLDWHTRQEDPDSKPKDGFDALDADELAPRRAKRKPKAQTGS